MASRKFKTVKEKKVITNPRDLTLKSQKKERDDLIALKKEELKRSLKVPPAINQFNTFLEESEFKKIFDLFEKYKPENRAEKKKRLVETNGKPAGDKPILVKFGLKHVTDLIERKVAKMVLIASDVDPIEIVLFLPTLCRKMGIPYAIVKSQSELGKLVNKKTSSCVCLCDVRAEDETSFKQAITKVNSIFMDCYEGAMKKWGDFSASKKSALQVN